MEKQKGFTLIELIIGVILLAIVSGISMLVVATGFQVVGDFQARKNIIIDGSNAITKFTRDYSHLTEKSKLLLADAKKIQFSNTQNQTLEYELTNGKLYRKVIGQPVSQIMATNVNVTTSAFHYFNNNNGELTTLPLSAVSREAVWMVELVLVLENGSESIRYIADVFPENLKL